MKTLLGPIVMITACAAVLLGPAAFATSAAKFNFLDADKDGRISRLEHAEGALLMFDRLDTDEDGVLTFAERQACRELNNAHNSGSKKEEKPTEGRAAEAEANAEIRLTRAENAAAADDMFTQLDTNKDGYLSKEECGACAVMAKKDK